MSAGDDEPPRRGRPSPAPPPSAPSDRGSRPASSTPPRRATGPILAADTENAARGARNVVDKCLVVARGERVHVLSFRAPHLARLLERAIRDAGADPRRVELDDFDKDEAVDALVARLAPLLAGVTAVVFLAPVRPPQTLSLAVATTAEKAGARMLYLLQVDERVLAQAARADPEPVAIINQRLTEALKPPSVLRVTSDAGTDLEIQLTSHHPLLAASGRPKPGKSENLPSGYVYTHPGRVSGVLVADRAIFGPKGEVDRVLLRKAPVRFEFQAGRVQRHDATDPAIVSIIEPYLASHSHAGRVGLVVLPTNYLVRSEIGNDRQDMLLPGAPISLGFADQASTGATYQAPVQLVLLGRRQTVQVGARKLIDAGRFADALVEGIDPFR
jgi:hypothetical protein